MMPTDMQQDIEGLVQNYLTSYIKWGSYNSFEPSPRYADQLNGQ